MMRRLLVAALALACGCKDYGHAVALTIVVDGASVSIEAIASVEIVVGGDEKEFRKTLAIEGQLDEGSAGFLYRPLIRDGAIRFDVSALDGDGALLAFGTTGARVEADSTTRATVTLVAGAAPDLAIDPPDLTSPEDGGVDLATGDAGDAGAVDGGTTCGDAGACTAAQLCCDQRCVAANESNCFGCGIACSGNTPYCSAIIRACGPCDPTFCARQHKDCAGTGECIACTGAPSPETRRTFWARAGATAPFTGSQGCPYPTITEALAKAHATTSVEPIAVNIGSGTYNPGETFPLTITRSMSIAGVGAANNEPTVIIGEGRIDRTAQGSSFTGQLDVTIHVASSGPVTIYGLQIFGLDLLAGGPDLALLCDVGNAYSAGNPDGGAPAEPSLIVNEVYIWGSFEVGVAAGSTEAPQPSGCNLRITRSTISNVPIGIRATGVAKSGAVLRAGLTVGGGNSFGGPQGNLIGTNRVASPAWATNNVGVGVRVEGGVIPVNIEGNTFKDGDVGVDLRGGSAVTIADNSFEALHVIGLRVGSSMVVDLLRSNLFSGVTKPTGPVAALCAGRPLACGLWVDSPGVGAQFVTARNNRFLDNDVGLMVTGQNFINAAPRAFDFGTAGDPGNNIFSCNSALDAQAGHDVWFEVAAGSSSNLKFAGNAWDHLVPVPTPSPAPNGWDLVVASPLTVNTAGALIRTDACAAGRVR